MRRSSIVSTFVFFLLLSFLFYSLSFTAVGRGLVGLLELGAIPIQKTLYTVSASRSKSPLQQMKEQNAELEAEVARYKEQEKEIKALRDQFATTSPVSSDLLPAQVIGLKAFIPGVSLPEQLIIDKGRRDGLHLNDAIVYKNNLIGKVAITNEHVSVVNLSFKKGFSVTAATSETNALGVSKGQGQGSIILDNVVLSDSLKKDDIVVTKGSTDSDGSGIPPGLIIGKITSIDKKASNLFQTATVQPLVDITRAAIVFVIVKS